MGVAGSCGWPLLSRGGLNADPGVNPIRNFSEDEHVVSTKGVCALPAILGLRASPGALAELVRAEKHGVGDYRNATADYLHSTCTFS